MEIIKLNGNYLEMYNSIDELPIVNFQNYNRAILIDAGLGSDLSDVANHITTIRRQVANKDFENANKELVNLQHNLSFIVSSTSPLNRAFYALIKSVNGKDLTDYSDVAIDKLIFKLSKKGLTIGKVKGFLNSVKKNLTRK